HLVFHAMPLKPFVETRVHRLNNSRPLPDLIKGQEEYKVEAILSQICTGSPRPALCGD
ncbi:hypothetical protein WOLCODRAFT_77368, partial [Wolfiporia cocos MD-104 SS10]